MTPETPTARTGEKRKKLGTLAALVGIAAILGNEMTGYIREHNTRSKCPVCTKGKMLGSNGIRYCQRCSHFEESL
jgi:hypothetical protein